MDPGLRGCVPDPQEAVGESVPWLCPGCSKKIAVPDIVAGECRKCEAALDKSPTVDLESDEHGLASQRALQSWLTRPDVVYRSDGLPLTVLPPRNHALYRFVYGLVRCIEFSERRAAGWEYVHHILHLPGAPQSLDPSYLVKSEDAKPTPMQSYALYATAYKALADWPNSFHCFLRSYRTMNAAASKETNAGGLYAEFGLLYQSWLERKWRYSEFDFVQAAFDQLVASDHLLAPRAAQSRRYQNTANLRSEAEAFIAANEAAKIAWRYH